MFWPFPSVELGSAARLVVGVRFVWWWWPWWVVCVCGPPFLSPPGGRFEWGDMSDMASLPTLRGRVWTGPWDWDGLGCHFR
jgi:hypothetical protein